MLYQTIKILLILLVHASKPYTPLIPYTQHTQQPTTHSPIHSPHAHTPHQLGLSNGLVPSRRKRNGKRRRGNADSGSEDEAPEYPPVELSEYEKQVLYQRWCASFELTNLSLLSSTVANRERMSRERTRRTEHRPRIVAL